jgi:hypothetical protein
MAYRRNNWRRAPIFRMIVPPAEEELAKPPAAPKKAKGKAIRRTEAEIDAMSEVSPADQRTAREDWIDHTVPRYRGLIDATEEPPEEEPPDDDAQ